MNSILLRTLQPPRTPSLLAFSDYREAEQANARHSSTTANGALLEYETLELRVHPPNVVVDNDSYSDRTLITLDSANRPGTLVEVVQLLTELGLCVTKARISSDGGWFVDEFHVTDGGKKVTNERKLRAIRKVLSVDTDPGSDGDAGDASVFEEASQCSTVFELAGNDRIGLLAEVIALLKNNGCEVRSAAVWTHNHRVAFVISVLEASPNATAGAVAAPGVHHTHLHNAATHHHGIAAAPGGGAGGGSSCPIKDGIKLARLRQLLLGMMDPSGQDSVVNVATTKGLIHYERRLHQLLLKEEEAQWRRAGELAAAYETELAELQAQQERRWAGGAWSSSAAAAGVAALAAATGRTRPQPITIYGGISGSAQPSPASLLSAAPSPSMAAGAAGPAGAAAAAGWAGSSVAGTPGAGASTATTPTGAASEVTAGRGPAAGPAAAAAAAAADAAAAAAAQVQSALGSPLLGSPESSVHGGRAPAANGAAASTTDGGATAAAAASGAGPDAGASGGSSADSIGQPSVLRASSVTSTSATAAAPNGATGSGAAAADSAPAGASTSTNASASASQYGGKSPAAMLAAPPSPSPPPAPSASSAQKPEVSIQHTKQHNYWMINIRCRDRQKLLFDTVCTLADLNYDVYHGAVDCEVERDRANGQPLSIAVQTFYLRPRYGDCVWDAKRAAKLKYMLEVAIQRRQPTGTKVHISGVPASASVSGGASAAGASDLPALTAVWRDFGLCISRAKVRALAGTAGEHTFYLVDRNGLPPADTVVQAACQQIGGVRLARPDAAGALGSSAGADRANVTGGSVGGKAGAGKGPAVPALPPGDYKFGFTVYSRAGWGGRDASNGAAESV